MECRLIVSISQLCTRMLIYLLYTQKTMSGLQNHGTPVIYRHDTCLQSVAKCVTWQKHHTAYTNASMHSPCCVWLALATLLHYVFCYSVIAFLSHISLLVHTVGSISAIWFDCRTFAAKYSNIRSLRFTVVGVYYIYSPFQTPSLIEPW